MTGGIIEINIIDDTSRRDCDIDCGTDWSSREAVILADQQIKNRFGGETYLEYIDLSQKTLDHRAAQWRQSIKERNLSIPLLLIDGQIRIAGQFDTRQIIDAVEVEMELTT